MRNVSDQDVEEIKTQILCSFLHRKSCRLRDNVGKYGTARQDRDGNIILLQRLCDRASVLCYKQEAFLRLFYYFILHYN